MPETKSDETDHNSIGAKHLIREDDTVESGERYAHSPVTDQWYRVTRWIDRGDGEILALDKEAVDEPPHHDEEKVHCPECETTVWKDDIEDAVEAAESHDDQQHGGEQTTLVNGILVPCDETAAAARKAINTISERTHE
jgi:hypothetical protein